MSAHFTSIEKYAEIYVNTFFECWQMPTYSDADIYTVVKRARVPAGSLVKMVTDAETLRPDLCELGRPYNLQLDHKLRVDTKKCK